ncbi:ankyrin repeat protein [Metarhizium robertsii]|uniref:Ankyrin repeat protein n=1 Tax=Metarhizium robertsii TaxID=568076 RepID=A0A014QRB0_9HYPO|nr:ankyrin repeat protein [Metarhizium robertsii]
MYWKIASRDDYTVGWVCALPIEVAAAKTTLDRVNDNPFPDRSSDHNSNYILGRLQGHSVVVAYPNYPLLWISGGPGKGKAMLAIYITEVLQPVADAADNVLLYYFCSNRDKNRNNALTIKRGILYQGIDLHPHLVKDIKKSFEGTETTKYTISSFVSLWGVFLSLLQQSTSSQVVCVLDGLDECEKEPLRQLLDAVDNYLSKSGEKVRPRLQLIILSRPQPANWHPSKTLPEEMVAQVQQTLLAGADGTFLLVGFVANELQGRSWCKIDEVLRHVPKGLGGIYRRLLQQISDKEASVPILQWVVLAARPLTVDELTVAAGIKTAGTLPATQVTKDRLRFGGLLVKVEGDAVNLVHESAKEFFQSDQTSMQTCLAHVERGYGNSGRIHEMSGLDPFLSYASQYWPVHFHQRHSCDRCTIRLLISKHSRLISRKDNYGRTPLSWAVNQGHREMVELLLDHGARVNFKDRSMLTALHIAVTGQHSDVMSVLLEHGARLEAKAEHGDTDTPLIRTILANSREMPQELLEHGARVAKLPALLGVASMRGQPGPVDERVKELLGLQEQVFLARFRRSSRFVDLELVQENKTDELREWGKLYHVFFLGAGCRQNYEEAEGHGRPVDADLAKHPPFFCVDRSPMAFSLFLQKVRLEIFRHCWPSRSSPAWERNSRLSDTDGEKEMPPQLRQFQIGPPSPATGTRWCSSTSACGVFERLRCVRSGNREENVLRTALLMTGHFAMIDKQEPGLIEYFSRVIAEFFAKDTSAEVELFSDANQACANELFVISESRDSAILRLFLTSIFQFAQQAHEKGQDRFLNVPSAACLILCQENATAHRWLIGEAIPDGIGALIAKEPPGSLQKRACKTFVECLILGKQSYLGAHRDKEWNSICSPCRESDI